MDIINHIELSSMEVVTPSVVESQVAQETSRHLSALLGNRTEYQIRLLDTQDTLTIPASAMQLLAHILAEMAQGNPVTVIPVHAELTTRQAANLLNVSRPFLIQQLENGDIPFRKVGTHRRIQFQHLMEYKQRIDEKRLAVLQELTDQAQELNMGY